MSKKIYLACPYTFNPELSFGIANKHAAQLMNEGHIVFSPISHSHPIADALDEHLRLDHEFWMKQDIPFVDWVDEVHVVVIGEEGMDLIKRSKGVSRELEYAQIRNKSIVYRHEDINIRTCSSR
jgi:nucleoside 2-deoxyribosyltransferase